MKRNTMYPTPLNEGRILPMPANVDKKEQAEIKSKKNEESPQKKHYFLSPVYGQKFELEEFPCFA